MTVEEAIRILDPETSKDAINEIKYYAGFNKDRVIDKVDEACIIACNIMKEYLEDKEVVTDNEYSYEELQDMSHDMLVSMFIREKKLLSKICIYCEKLEKENNKLTNLDELINSISD